MNTPDGGPAFPRPYVIDEQSAPDSQYKQAQTGMSTRVWLVGQALKGLLASGHFTVEGDENEPPTVWRNNYCGDDDKRRYYIVACDEALAVADAVLAELEEKP